MRQLLHVKGLLAAIMLMMSARTNAQIWVDGIFYECDYTELTATVSYPYSDKYIGDIVIPPTITLYSETWSGETDSITFVVTSIGRNAFSSCSDITSVTIPSTVKSIGFYAFGGCTSLSSINIPSSVTNIGLSAFDFCCNITSFIVDNGNPNYSSIETTLYDKVQTKLIKVCGNPKSIKIPNCVKTICEGALSDCPNLTEINIPESVTTIEDYAFSGCSNLNSITIPQNVSSIGINAFSYCRNLETLMVDENNKCFSAVGTTLYNKDKTKLVLECTLPKEYTIPDGVITIGPCAFSASENLTSVIIPNSVTTIEFGAFSFSEQLTSITLPNSVKSIDWNAFMGCIRLKSLTFTNNISIGESAFDGCTGLTTLTFTDSVFIDDYAFRFCTNLKEIYCLHDNPSCLAEGVFNGIDENNVTLYVPYGTLEAYKSASGWNIFTNIKEFDPETVNMENINNSVETGNVKTENDAIVVENYNGVVRIYDISGKIIKETSISGKHTKIVMPRHGVYVIKMGTKSIKVAL